MPNFMKKTLLFGVVVPEEVSGDEEVLKIQKSYKRNYALSSIFISVILNIISINTESVNLLSFGVFILIANMAANYIYTHYKSKNLKKDRKWNVNKKQIVIVNTSNRYNEKYLSPYWFLIPLSIVGFTIIFTMIQYPHLPDQIPIHFDLYGNITNYSDKSFWSVFGLPFTQIGMTGMFFGIYKIIQRVRPSIQASRPKVSLKQNQIAKRYWAIYLLVILIVINLQFAYTQLSILKVTDSKSVVSLLIHGLSILIPMIGVILVSLKTGQSGSKIKVEDEEELNNSVIDRDDDRFWKLGMIYYNPDDPSLFVEKRFGIGWTFNLGCPAGILILGILIVSIIASLVLL